MKLERDDLQIIKPMLFEILDEYFKERETKNVKNEWWSVERAAKYISHSWTKTKQLAVDGTLQHRISGSRMLISSLSCDKYNNENDTIQ